MTFEIELNGRTRAVSVERIKPAAVGAPAAGASSPSQGQATHQFRVTIDGEAHLVDAVRLDAGALSLIMPGGGPSHRIVISESPSAAGTSAGELTLAFPGATVRATVNGRRVRRGSETAGAEGEQRLNAPMPGRVLRVLVAPGDEVALRQPLIVVEAMKMENELGSPKAGRVKDVLVSEGQSVEAGRLLVVVE